MNNNDILKAIRPLKNRIHVNNAIFCILVGLVAAAALCLILSWLALFLPIPFLPYIVVGIFAAGLALSLILSVFLRPGDLKTIKVADSLGLKERLITFYELRAQQDPVSKMQRYDALKAVSKVDFKALYRYRFPKRLGLTLLGLMICITVSFLIPSQSKEKARQIEAFVSEVQAQVAKLAEEQKELDKKEGLSEEKLREVNKKLDELLKELKKADTESEALKSLSQATHALEDLKNKGQNSELSRLEENLSRNPLTGELAQALEDGDSTDIKQKLEELAEKLKSLDGENKKELSEVLQKASNDAAKNQALSDNLANLGESVASGNVSASRAELSNLENTLSELLEDSAPEDAGQQAENEAIGELVGSVGDAKSKISALSRGNGGKGKAGQQAKSQDGDNGQQSSNAQQGSGSGSGQGQKGGQQSGNGQSNQGGSGAGNTTSSGNLGYTGEESGSGSRAPGEKKTRDYESIYVPERLGGDAEQSMVKGQKGDAGQSTWSQSNKPVEKGSVIPYNQVLGEYRNEAMSSIQEGGVPPVMKDIVRDYFTSLE